MEIRRPLHHQLAHLFQDARREERDDGDESDDTHVPDVVLDHVGDTPQADGDEADESDPVLLSRERFVRRANSFDLDVAFPVGRPGWLV